jgi:hypothetical protein
MAKVDFKSLDSYRARAGQFRIVDVPPLTYLMVDGHGDPNTSSEYSDAIRALFPVAYALKFASKREDPEKDFVVMPLEALWWADDLSAFTSRRDKSRWSWTAMIMVPEWITADMVVAAVASVAAKVDSGSLKAVRLETLREGTCVQTLHIGSYDDETETLARLHDEFIPEANLRMTGKHHEIYLSDSRRVAPAKLRTILRQPVEHVDAGPPALTSG